MQPYSKMNTFISGRSHSTVIIVNIAETAAAAAVTAGAETGTAVTSRATNKTTRVSDFSILYYVRPGRCHIATSERMSHDSVCRYEYDNNWQTVVNNRLVNKR